MYSRLWSYVNLIVVYVNVVNKLYKNSIIILETCSQRLYRVFDYAEFRFRIFKFLLCTIIVVYMNVK